MFSFEPEIEQPKQIQPIVPKINLSPDALLGGFMKDFGVLGSKTSWWENWVSDPHAYIPPVSDWTQDFKEILDQVFGSKDSKIEVTDAKSI